MSRIKTAIIMVLVLLDAQFASVTSNPPQMDKQLVLKVDILQEKLLGMGKSLSQDIELLRLDMRTISEELNRATEKLTEVISKDVGDRNRNGDEGEPAKVNKDQMKSLDDLSQRIKRAFAAEKVKTRFFMSELRSEIDEFGVELTKVLSEVKERQAAGHAESVKILTEHTSGFMVQMKQVMEDVIADELRTSLQPNFRDISDNLDKTADQCTSGIQSMTKTYDMNALNIASTLRNLSIDLSSVSSTIGTKNDDVIRQITVAIRKISDSMDDNEDKLNSVYEKVQRMEAIYARGHVRLANITETESSIGGRLEVIYSDRWGTVCDDRFDMKDANVACKMLGFSTASKVMYGAYFGAGVNDIWMDDVKCSGKEKSLFACDRVGAGKPGTEDCAHSEDVGVICLK